MKVFALGVTVSAKDIRTEKEKDFLASCLGRVTTRSFKRDGKQGHWSYYIIYHKTKKESVDFDKKFNKVFGKDGRWI